MEKKMDANSTLKYSIPPDMHAMVVEDSKATRLIIKKELETLGIKVTEASNGEEALKILKKNIVSFHIIFSDVVMEKMDGFELCHNLQQADWYDKTPFVIISTLSDASNVIKALKLGADDFIPKPFNKEDLLRIIGRVSNYGY